MQHSISALKIAATLLVILMTPKIHSMETQLVPYFDTLPDEQFQNVVYNIKYPEDIISFGLSHKRAAGLFRNYDFLDSLVKKRTLLPYSVEDTHFYRVANENFRILIVNNKIISTEKQIATLDEMYNLYGGSKRKNLIDLNTCGKAKKARHDSSCIIPLVKAYSQDNIVLARYLISISADISLNPRSVCYHQCDSLIDTILDPSSSIPLFPCTKTIGRIIKASNEKVVIPEDMLHKALDKIRNHPDNKNDYKGIRTLIEYGAPVNGLSAAYAAQRPPLSTLLYIFDTNLSRTAKWIDVPSLTNIMTVLLDAGADENLKDAHSNPPAYYAAKNPEALEVFNSVVQKHAEFVKKHTPNK
jgi:hypothetical protein